MGTQVKFHTIGSKNGLVPRVVKELEELIISGDLSPGTKLPPQNQLSEEMGVSRTVLREAVKILTTKGLLKTKHGVGTVVQNLSSGHLTEPLSLLIRANGENSISVAQIQQVRSILEIEIASLAAEYASDSDICELSEIWDRMKNAGCNHKLLTECDLDFHRYLGKMTGNPLLVILLDSIRELLKSYISQVINYLDPQEDVLPAHFDIINAVKSKNPKRARNAMRAHQNQMMKNYEKYLMSNVEKGLEK